MKIILVIDWYLLSVHEYLIYNDILKGYIFFKFWKLENNEDEWSICSAFVYTLYSWLPNKKWKKNNTYFYIITPEWKTKVETTVNTLKSPMMNRFEPSKPSARTSQRGHRALPDAAGQGPECEVHKLQRTEKQLRSCSIQAVGNSTGQTFQMEWKGEHLDEGCTFRFKNSSTRLCR